jgi:enterochelin esterase family protein
MSAEEPAANAKLSELPAWKPGLGVGNFMTASPYAPAPETIAREGVPQGKVVSFSMPLAESKFYPPTGLRGTVEARRVHVYVPAGYVAGTPAPLLVTHDAMGANDTPPAPKLPIILDNLIAEKRVPAMVAVMLMHGGGDGPGSQRGLEYDTVSGKYAEFIEAEVLPRAAKEAGVTFTTDPEGRASMGGSSGGSAAFSMAWFHPELYRRLVIYSGTFVGQARDPVNAPHGAWEYHENFIPKSPAKPLHVWLQVSDRDNGATRGGGSFGNWVLANIYMSEVLKAKGYRYQFVFSKDAGHVDRPIRALTMGAALEWVWQGYKPSGK